jgi:hypothetical protein
MTDSRSRLPLLAAVAATAALAAAPLAGAAAAGDNDPGYTGIPPKDRTAAVSGLPGVDRVPPVVRAVIATRHLRTLVRTGTLRLSATLNERGGIGMVGVVQAVKMRRGARLPKSLFYTSSDVKLYGGPETHTLELKLTPSAVRQLRRARTVKVAVAYAADDAVRNRAKGTLKRTLR